MTCGTPYAVTKVPGKLLYISGTNSSFEWSQLGNSAKRKVLELAMFYKFTYTFKVPVNLIHGSITDINTRFTSVNDQPFIHFSRIPVEDEGEETSQDVSIKAYKICRYKKIFGALRSCHSYDQSASTLR